jgi:hypothetical protein
MWLLGESMFFMPNKPAESFSAGSRIQWLIVMVIQFLGLIFILVGGVTISLYYLGIVNIPEYSVLLWITVLIFIVQMSTIPIINYFTGGKKNTVTDDQKTVTVKYPIEIKYLDKESTLILNISSQGKEIPEEKKEKFVAQILPKVFEDLELQFYYTGK